MSRNTGRSYNDFFWHAGAIERLAALINATITSRGVSMQEFTRIVKKGGGKISFNTIWRLANQQVRRPSASALQALAPYLYRVKELHPDGTMDLDILRTFDGANGWLELTSWCVDAPIEKATPATSSTALADFLIQYCAQAGLTQLDFERQAEAETGLEAKRLRQIMMGGGTIYDDDLYWLSHLIRDDQGQPYPWQFWQQLKQGIEADALQNSNNHADNHADRTT